MKLLHACVRLPVALVAASVSISHSGGAGMTSPRMSHSSFLDTFSSQQFMPSTLHVCWVFVAKEAFALV